MAKRHECRYWEGGHRGWRWCRYCSKRQRWIAARQRWENVWEASGFAQQWLPAISGTNPHKMMSIEVAFPFEWNCYESWNIVFRVRFEFEGVTRRREAGQATRADIMNGWESPWRETFNEIDADARAYYQERTGNDFRIGDNTYEEMRRIIQS